MVRLPDERRLRCEGGTWSPLHWHVPSEGPKGSDGAVFGARHRSPLKVIQQFTFRRSGFEMQTPDAPGPRTCMQRALREALRRDEFVLHYQPQFDVESGRLAGFEALLRWHRGGKTWLNPDVFIEPAETTGLIVPIGDFVLATAAAQLRHWHGLGHTEMKVSVNVSAVQLQQWDFVPKVAAILWHTKLDPASLELEITESVALDGNSDAQHVVATLKKMGIAIALDDFGTRYSSLRYLRDFSPDRLKIDRSFVAMLKARHDGANFVQALIDLGTSLNVKVTAEGVETGEQLQMLQKSGCDRVQGFLLGKPMNAADTETFLARGVQMPLASPRAQTLSTL